MIDEFSRGRARTCVRVAVCCALLLLGAPRALSAQEDAGGAGPSADAARRARIVATDAAVGLIPHLAPLNPLAAARTGLYVQPFVLPRDGWSPMMGVAYTSAIEYQQVGTTRYILDAEILTVEVGATHDLGDRAWVAGSVGVAAAFDGVFDGFFDWYHERIGFAMPERDLRPTDVFADSLRIPALGIDRVRERSGIGMTDARLTTGLRWSDASQTALSVTIPLAGSDALFGRGVPTVNVLQTLRARVMDRAAVEATAGIGYTPRSGALATIQRELFWIGSVSTRLHFGGGHAAYGTVFAHSSTYRATGLRVMDGGELTADFGYAHRWASGREVRIGLTEDVFRQDQGVDLALRVSVIR